MCGVVYIQSRGQKDNFEFDINEVTPSLLKDVFELESLPYFLQSKANKKLVEIEKQDLVLNEQYLINSPNHEVTKKNKRRRREMSWIEANQHTFIFLLTGQHLNFKNMSWYHYYSNWRGNFDKQVLPKLSFWNSFQIGTLLRVDKSYFSLTKATEIRQIRQLSFHIGCIYFALDFKQMIFQVSDKPP